MKAAHSLTGTPDTGFVKMYAPQYADLVNMDEDPESVTDFRSGHYNIGDDGRVAPVDPEDSVRYSKQGGDLSYGLYNRADRPVSAKAPKYEAGFPADWAVDLEVGEDYTTDLNNGYVPDASATNWAMGRAGRTVYRDAMNHFLGHVADEVPEMAGQARALRRKHVLEDALSPSLRNDPAVPDGFKTATGRPNADSTMGLDMALALKNREEEAALRAKRRDEERRFGRLQDGEYRIWPEQGEFNALEMQALKDYFRQKYIMDHTSYGERDDDVDIGDIEAPRGADSEWRVEE